MRIGVVIGADGSVKRTWALVSGDCAVAVEHGDELVEWEMPHGSEASTPDEREKQIASALAVQEALVSATTRDHILTLSDYYHAARNHRRVNLQLVSDAHTEHLYSTAGYLASRDRGSTQFPADPSHGTLHEAIWPDTHPRGKVTP
jgi:lactam utilization protein B